MLIKNNGTNPITMNLRDGSSYVLQPGVPTSVPDAATTMIDDSSVLIALFNAGTLVAYTDSGSAYPGFPTSVNVSDVDASKVYPMTYKGGTLSPDSLAALAGSGVVLSSSNVFAAFVRDFRSRRDSNPLLDGTVNSDVTVAISTADTNEFSADASVQATLADVVDIQGGLLAADSYAGQWRIDGSLTSTSVTGGMFRTIYSGTKCVIRIKDSVMGSRILVNGKLAQAALIDTTAGNRYVKLTFPRNGRYLIELDTCQNGGIRGLYAEANGQFIKPEPRKLRLVIAGDSTIGNAVNDTDTSVGGTFRGLGIWPRWLAAASNSNCIQSSTPSMGYAAGGNPLTNRLTELTTAYSATAYALCMGVNDAPQYGTTISVATFEAAVRASIQAILTNDPGKPVTVFGVLRSPAFPNNVACELSIKAVADSFNNKLVRFYPLCSGTNPFMSGSGYQGSPGAAGTCNWIVGPDGTHITYDGNRAISKYVGDCLVDHYSRLFGY